MAFFGGVNTGRPWPRLNSTSIAINGLLALAFFLLAIYFLAPQESTKSTVVVKETTTQQLPQVVVPARNIEAGERLHTGLFQMVERDVRGMEAKVIYDVEELTDGYAAVKLVAGVPVIRDHLKGNFGGTNAVTRQIPKGHRAVSIPVNEATGVEGWALPGSKVDVVWHTEHRGRSIVSVIVENVKILSAGRRTGSENGQTQDGGSANFVTLLVPTKEAQKIQLAKSSEGMLSLSLRGEEDGETVGSSITSVQGLLQARDLAQLDEIQGEVEIGRKKFVLKGGKLEAKKTSPVKSTVADSKKSSEAVAKS